MSETVDEFPPSTVEPTVGPAAVRHRTWVLARDGIVTHVRHTLDWFNHPFGKGHGGRVLDGTGTEVAPGYFVDAKGNFTPAEGRTVPIPQGLPAYHAGPGTPTASAAEVAASLAGNATMAVPERAAAPVQNVGLATIEPRNKDEAEHDDGSEPVHTTGVVDPEDAPAAAVATEEPVADRPSGFAAMDAKAEEHKAHDDHHAEG